MILKEEKARIYFIIVLGWWRCSRGKESDIIKGSEVEKVKVHLRNSMRLFGGRGGLWEPRLKSQLGSDGEGLFNALLRSCTLFQGYRNQ